MDEADFKTLLATLPVSWWEADGGSGLVESGGGAFADERTARRFLEALGGERGGPSALLGDGPCQARFEGRTFDVNRSVHGGGAQRRRSRGVAVEVGGTAPGPGAYASFADLSPAAVFVRDAEGRYVWANHAYAHLYGTTRDHLIGRHLTETDGPEEAARFLALDEEVLSGGHSVRHTLAYRRPDGSPGHAAGYRFPLSWGTLRCVAGIYVDITEYTHALDQWRQAEEDLRALRDHSGLPCLRLSADGVVGEASAAVAELLRVRLRDLIGSPADSLLAETPERAALHRIWDDLIGGRRRSARTSAVLVDGDRRRRRAWLHLSAVRRHRDWAPEVWAVVTRLGLSHEPHPPLTAAQVRILALLAAGHSNADIAEALRLSRQTVDYHLSRLRHLLGGATRPALVARAYVLGILSPHTWPPRSTTAAHPLSPA
ncbi:PAS domain-containing protein [Streptomyces echinatus]|uniref:PAS domain S-box-containing protein n=1 Tax=Streptomyces echinatus TaxID=67293 RepID=A0A7W9PQH3_9ACTN|nr:PAS domain-containing protein [Streptomyces echinatus]MBB5925779.1 PAS domain S-box-containing protein [Streptomyces echinatus]